MKKILSLLLAAVMLLGLVPGCSAPAEKARVQVVTTCFAVYDWTRAVVGEAEGVSVTWLMDSGVDPHSFQPSMEDLTKVSACDLFVFVGGESDGWTADAVAEAKNENQVALSLLDALGDAAVAEEEVPGAEPETEEEAGALDEHIWMSLRNADVCVAAIAAALREIDPENSDLYAANAEAYRAELAALDREYEDAVANAALRTILVADRFPFRYLAEDYGLEYYAAFSGCSAETEASFQTVTGLADTVDTLGLPVILVTENGTGDIAETISENTHQAPVIRTLDSLQTVTADIAAEGVTYLSIMKQNLTVLKEALECRS